MSGLRLSQEPLSEDACRACEHAERISALYRDLELELGSEAVLLRDRPMASLTTLRVGGPADLYVEPDSEAALSVVLHRARVQGVPWVLVGRGSNLLVRDGGIRGLVIGLRHPGFRRLEVEGERIEAGAGVPLKDVAHAARRAGLAGLEFLEGIPGTMGGALRMNAGAMGTGTFDVVETMRTMTWQGQAETWRRADIDVTYRACPMLRERIALGAVLRGRAADTEEVRARMAAYSEKRWSSQPREPSGGCTFKNPSADLPAGRLIEELGLKGERCGGAMVSTVHGNFFVNLGGARAADVLALVERVRRRALEERGVELEMELEVMGED